MAVLSYEECGPSSPILFWLIVEVYSSTTLVKSCYDVCNYIIWFYHTMVKLFVSKSVVHDVSEKLKSLMSMNYSSKKTASTADRAVRVVVILLFQRNRSLSHPLSVEILCAREQKLLETPLSKPLRCQAWLTAPPAVHKVKQLMTAESYVKKVILSTSFAWGLLYGLFNWFLMKSNKFCQCHGQLSWWVSIAG